MLCPFLLALFASAPAAASTASPSTPEPRVEFAGYLRDTHFEVGQDGKAHLSARIEGPMTLDRRTFVIEGLDAAGNVVVQRTVRACVAPGTARRHHARAARVEVDLGDLTGVAVVRARSAG